jgi:gas vesicle protein
MDGKRAFSFIVGLLSGAVVGAAVAILLAPQSGSDIRKSVTGKVNELVALGRQARYDRRRELQQQYVEAIQIPLTPKKEGSA